MKCTSCQDELRPESSIAAITGGILGDEVCDVFYLCPACGFYTIVTCWDRFSGEESSRIEGPVPRTEGDALVALIRSCPTPWDKTCRCQAHMTYFEGSLD